MNHIVGHMEILNPHNPAQFGIKAFVVVPGMAPSTRFASTAQDHIMEAGGFPDPYAEFGQQTLAMMQSAGAGPVTTAQDVAEAVFRAATDPDCPTILPAGEDAVAWAAGK